MEIDELQLRFGLAKFHVDALNWFDQAASLRGKRVLELAGSDLPRQVVLEHYGALQWVCIDDPEGHMDIHKRDKPKLAEHYANELFLRQEHVSEQSLERDYLVVLGDAANISSLFFDKFDLVVSIAGLEHIANISTTLDCSHKALRAGGKLAADFGPIWSSVKGHHLDNVRNKNGERADWSNANCPIPPWGHLLLDEPEMMELLMEHFEPDVARYSCDAIYRSRTKNRFFCEDFFRMFANSNFKAFRWEKYWVRKPDPQTLARLMMRHPGRTEFAQASVRVLLEK